MTKWGGRGSVRKPEHLLNYSVEGGLHGAGVTVSTKSPGGGTYWLLSYVDDRWRFGRLTAVVLAGKRPP